MIVLLTVNADTNKIDAETLHKAQGQQCRVIIALQVLRQRATLITNISHQQIQGTFSTLRGMRSQR